MASDGVKLVEYETLMYFVLPPFVKMLQPHQRAIAQDVTFEMADNHSQWPDGARCPENVIARNGTDYKVFAYSEDIPEGWEPLRKGYLPITTSRMMEHIP